MQGKVKKSDARAEFFRRLQSELRLLEAAAEKIGDQPEVSMRLKTLHKTAHDLADFAAKKKITYDDAEFAFKNELKEFITFLSGRLD